MRSSFESFLVVALLTACDPNTASMPPAEPTQVEPAPLPSLEGVTPLRVQDPALEASLEGKVAVIDLWATWCEPCRASIPKVVRLSQAYPPEKLVVAGIHVGAGVETAERYAADAGISYALYADEAFAFSDRVGSRSVPMLLVVDAGGMIVHRTSELDAQTLAIVRGLVEASSS